MSARSVCIRSLALLAAFALSVSGCASSTIPPAPSPPAATVVPSPAVQATTPTPLIEGLPEFFAQTVAAGDDLASARERIIVYSQAVDRRNLYMGVSRLHEHMRRCWMYRDGTLVDCTGDDIERAFYVQEGKPPIPKLFFAIATVNDDRVLVLLDIQYSASFESTDGFRYVLQSNQNRWRVVSRTRVY